MQQFRQTRALINRQCYSKQNKFHGQKPILLTKGSFNRKKRNKSNNIERVIFSRWKEIVQHSNLFLWIENFHRESLSCAKCFKIFLVSYSFTVQDLTDGVLPPILCSIAKANIFCNSWKWSLEKVDSLMRRGLCTALLNSLWSPEILRLPNIWGVLCLWYLTIFVLFYFLIVSKARITGHFFLCYAC